MKPLRYYQIPYSHYCDKVRWALDFFSIPYETINYVGRGTPGLNAAPRTLQKLYPIIEDPNNDSLFISDSTPILLYLESRCGNEKSLFTTDPPIEQNTIINYCLTLDSQLGLYSRRLAYIHIIAENPAIVAVLMDGNYEKTSCDDWRSYFLGTMCSCILIGRLGVHRIREEHILEKTENLLETIQQDIDGKHYLFGDRFTAADLTLTALIQPLKVMPAIHSKYQSVFQYCDRIRKEHDPKGAKDSVVERLLKRERRKPPPSRLQSTFRTLIWYIFYFLFYPLKLIFSADMERSPVLQYASKNLHEKANNDVRVIKLNSTINTVRFYIKYFWHLCFTIPKQMEFVNHQAKRILNKDL